MYTWANLLDSVYFATNGKIVSRSLLPDKQGDPKVTPSSKIKMVCFCSVIFSFNKPEKKVHCMDFHLKFIIFL